MNIFERRSLNLICVGKAETNYCFNMINHIKIFYYIIQPMNETFLYEKIQWLEQENKELKEKLKHYTAPTRSKTFYENHKEDIKQKSKEYKEKTNYYANLSPEKKKEYARRAYLNQKAKKEQQTEQSN